MTSRDLCIGEPDARLRSALTIMFGNIGWTVRAVENGEALLVAVLERPPCCVVMDIHAPAKGCLDTLSGLRAQGFTSPIIAMSTLQEAAIVVAAMKRGADDFVQKPCRPEAIHGAIMAAMAEWTEKSLGRDETLARRFVGHAMLTEREIEILRCIAAGSTAREAGTLLGISPRTVEFHRGKIMQKFCAKNAAELMRIVLRTAGNC